MIECKRVFLDTAPVIYYLQQDENYFEKVKQILYNLRISKASFVSSDIMLAEYSVFPLRTGKENLLRALNEFVVLADVEIVHTSNEIAMLAARIRADYKGFKSMDAFQLATAVISGCDLFLTNDKQLRQYRDMKCMTVEDFDI